MKVYSYEAVDFSGIRKKGKIQAEILQEALEELKSENLIPISVNVDSSRKLFLGSSELPLKKQIMLCQQMAVLLNAGVPVNEAIHIMLYETKGRQRRIMEQISGSLERGYSLAAAMNMTDGAFSNFMITMVGVGENSGSLGQVFEKLAMILGKKYQARSKLQLALAYPVFLAGMSVFLVMFLLQSIIPVLVSVFAAFQGELPWTTRLLIEGSRMIQNYGVAGCIAAFIMALLGYTACQKKEIGCRVDKYLLHLPVLGRLLRLSDNAIFFNTLGLTVQCGITVQQGVEMLQEISSNEYVKEQYRYLSQGLQQGYSLSQCVSKTNLFDDHVSRMVRAGEEAGELAVMLNQAGKVCAMAVDSINKKIQIMAEPAAVIVLGCVVGFLVMSTIMPILDLMLMF